MRLRLTSQPVVLSTLSAPLPVLPLRLDALTVMTIQPLHLIMTFMGRPIAMLAPMILLFPLTQPTFVLLAHSVNTFRKALCLLSRSAPLAHSQLAEVLEIAVKPAPLVLTV